MRSFTLPFLGEDSSQSQPHGHPWPPNDLTTSPCEPLGSALPGPRGSDVRRPQTWIPRSRFLPSTRGAEISTVHRPWPYTRLFWPRKIPQTCRPGRISLWECQPPPLPLPAGWEGAARGRLPARAQSGCPGPALLAPCVWQWLAACPFCR